MKKQTKLEKLNIELGFVELATLVQGNPIKASMPHGDSEIMVEIKPVDGGIPLDLKYIEMMADRYTLVLEAIKKASKKAAQNNFKV